MTRRSSLSDNSALRLADASRDYSNQMLFLTASLLYASPDYRFTNTLRVAYNVCETCRRERNLMYILLITCNLFIIFLNSQ